MARPKADKDKIRKINLTIRLTEGEHQRLKTAAEVCGKLPVTFAREKIFKGRFPSAQLPRIETNTYLELKKIGVRLDQLKRFINAEKVGIELITILLQLKSQQEKIISQIFYHDSYPKDR